MKNSISRAMFCFCGSFKVSPQHRYHQAKVFFLVFSGKCQLLCASSYHSSRPVTAEIKAWDHTSLPSIFTESLHCQTTSPNGKMGCQVPKIKKASSKRKQVSYPHPLLLCLSSQITTYIREMRFWYLKQWNSKAWASKFATVYTCKLQTSTRGSSASPSSISYNCYYWKL